MIHNCFLRIAFHVTVTLLWTSSVSNFDLRKANDRTKNVVVMHRNYLFNEIVHDVETDMKQRNARLNNDISLNLIKTVGDASLRGYNYQYGNGSGCQCIGYSCGCCVHMDVPKISLNDTGCLNLTYLPKEYGISLTFEIDDRILINETISARNPPPVCFGIPYFEKEASICLSFYDLDIKGHIISGCAKVEVRLYGVMLEDFDLGCFKLGSHLRLNKVRTNIDGTL